MWNPEGSGSNNDDMFENGPKDLQSYTTLIYNFGGSGEFLRPVSSKINRLGTHINIFGRWDSTSAAFEVTSLMAGTPQRSNEVVVSTDSYIYTLGGSSTSVVRTDLDGSNFTSLDTTGMATSSRGTFALESGDDRIFIIGKTQNSSNLWYRELTDAQSSGFTSGSLINSDGTITNFNRSEMGAAITHKGDVYLIKGSRLLKFVPGNTSPQTIGLPSSPTGGSVYGAIWEDPYGLLVLRLHNYTSGNTGAEAYYYSSNNGGSTWVPNYYPKVSDMNVEYYTHDVYLYGRRQQQIMKYNDDVSKNVYTIRQQTVTVTDGEDLSSMNAGDIVKPPGITDPLNFSKINTITSNGDGTTDILINGFIDFSVGDFVESVAPTGTATSTRFLVINTTGAVTTTQVADPGFTELGPGTTQQITFPATFPTGSTPDAELPAGTTLQVEVEATNTVASDTFPSNIITPA